MSNPPARSAVLPRPRSVPPAAFRRRLGSSARFHSRTALAGLVTGCMGLLGLDSAAAKEAAIEWHGSYDKAFGEAIDRGVPVVIVLIEDGEEANEDVWGNTLRTKEFAEATRHCVAILANRGKEKDHGTRTVTAGGKERTVCKKFGGIRCPQHAEAEIGMFRDFAKDGVLKTPLVLVTLPDQTLVRGLHDRHPLTAYLEAIEEARQKLPDGLDVDEAVAVREGLAGADEALAAGRVQDVLRFALPYAKRNSEGRLLAQVKALLARVEGEGEAALKGVESQVEAKDYADALRALEEIRERYRGSRIEGLARERFVRLGKDPAVKKALNAAKREASAAELLKRADEARAAGAPERAEKLEQQLREKFADTGAAQELAGRTPGRSQG